jgi:hypothetical protein
VADVRRVLDELVAEDPERGARRAREGAPARYLDHGKPDCLVAVVLHRLGASLGVLRALDQESGSKGAGAMLRFVQHPWRRRVEPLAWDLLCFLQRENDAGASWGQARTQAFTLDRYWKRVHPPHAYARLPWVTDENEIPQMYPF